MVCGLVSEGPSGGLSVPNCTESKTNPGERVSRGWCFLTTVSSQNPHSSPLTGVTAHVQERAVLATGARPRGGAEPEGPGRSLRDGGGA